MNEALDKVSATLAQWKAAESELNATQKLLTEALETSAATSVVAELKLRVAVLQESTQRFYRLSLEALRDYSEQRNRQDGVSGS